MSHLLETISWRTPRRDLQARLVMSIVSTWLGESFFLSSLWSFLLEHWTGPSHLHHMPHFSGPCTLLSVLFFSFSRLCCAFPSMHSPVFNSIRYSKSCSKHEAMRWVLATSARERCDEWLSYLFVLGKLGKQLCFLWVCTSRDHEQVEQLWFALSIFWLRCCRSFALDHDWR